jgi:hypothetical protein
MPRRARSARASGCRATSHRRRCDGSVTTRSCRSGSNRISSGRTSGPCARLNGRWVSPRTTCAATRSRSAGSSGSRSIVGKAIGAGSATCCTGRPC